MTQDEIIEMAQECKLIGMRPFIDGIYTEALIEFAHLVAAKATEEANARETAPWTLMCKKMVAFEREACAKMLEDWNKHAWNPFDCAEAIRARGQE
jgi:hypothetical protein